VAFVGIVGQFKRPVYSFLCRFCAVLLVGVSQDSAFEVCGLAGHPADGAVFQHCVVRVAGSLFSFQSILPRHNTPTLAAQISTPSPIEVEDESSSEPSSQRGRNTYP